MPKQNIAKEIFEKIDSDKEILAVMPKNNIKNREKYYEAVEELQKEYNKYEKEIFEELKKRYEKEVEIEINPDIKELESRINAREKILHLLDEDKTSYERMGLDKVIYKLEKFYKENLENVNQQILKAIQVFSNVGINLKESDFNYSEYVKEYMETFFKEMKNGNINSNTIKEKFEQIYWKCSDIVIHIELNFRNIYMKNETVIDKYFSKERNMLLKNWKKTPDEIIKFYLELKAQKIEKEQKDKSILLNRFIDGELQTKDYLSAKLKDSYNKLISLPNEEKLDEKESEINISKFLNCLYEYKNYMEFEFIIKDIKKYYNEKENYKKTYEQIRKTIRTNEEKLKKINKKIVKKNIFTKSKEINQKAIQNEIILQLRDNYKELEKDKFYYEIDLRLNDKSSLYDILDLANSYYCYMIDCMIRNDKTITQDEMDEKIGRLDKFLKDPYNALIKNITILENKDIAMIIKDRAKLMNFNVEKEDIEEDNIDSLIQSLETIRTGINLKQIGLDINRIEELCSIKKIL